MNKQGGVFWEKKQLEINPLDVERKLQIIQWHAEVCLDGQPNPWKTKLATALGVNLSLVSKWSKRGMYFNRPGKFRKCLAGLKDETLLGCLGFVSRSDDPNHAETLQRLSEIEDAGSYAVLAKASGCELSESGERIWKRWKRRQRNFNHPWLEPGVAGELVPNPDRYSEILDAVPLHDMETEKVADIFTRLTKERDVGRGAPAVVVHAAPHVGLSFLLRRLLHQPKDFSKFYRGGVLHLYLEQIENLRETGREVASLMRQSRSVSSPSTSKRKGWGEVVAEALIQNEQLLVVHGASSVVHDNDNKKTASHFISAVAQRLEERTKKAGDTSRRCSRLLLTVWNRDDFARVNDNRTETLDFEPAFETGNDAFDYFRNCVEHYRMVRAKSEGNTVSTFPEPGNNALKRIQHHYSKRSKAGFTPAPSSIRFRALCVTDVDAPSPLDPTQGIEKRLDEYLRRNVPEISMTLSDIQTFVRKLEPAGEETARELVRTGSTALFYLTEEMLKNVQTKVASAAHGDGSLFVPQVLQELARVRDGDRLILPLLVRALIQDDWILFDAEGRTRVHKAIAEILSDICERNDPEEMDRELPYSAPWGNRRIVFALEAIRHYIRASRTANNGDKQELVQKAMEVYETYLEGGMFPEVAGSEPKIGDLSRAFGMDQLKFEALCLLSEDGLGKKPPIGSGSEYHSRFFREIGIALTHMLRPDEAVEFFDLAEAQGIDGAERAYILSHRITASLEIGAVPSALSDLEFCESAQTALPEGSAERQALAHRIEARKAAIEFAQGNRSDISSFLDEIAAHGLETHTGDRAILYIDTHLPTFPDKGEVESLSHVWMVLKQARNHALRNLYEHERVRLDIREGQILRLLGMPKVAVPVLERVGLELQEFGGSETAFREFQLASAEVLSDLKKPRYAFAAYALPAFRSLSRRHVNVRTAHARKICQHLIDNMTDDEILEPIQNNPFRKKIRDLDDSSRHPSYSLDVLPTEEDLQQVFDQCGTAEGRNCFKVEICEARR